MKFPDIDIFVSGYTEYQKREKRDSMYKVSTFLIEAWWGEVDKMADALGVLLLTWNNAFYRYGQFDYDNLQKCIEKNIEKIANYRNRNIVNVNDTEKSEIETLFIEFNDALRIVSENEKVNGRKSPVAVGKTLHLLAPYFFPIWDDKISRAYNLNINKNPEAKYADFCLIMKEMAINYMNTKIDSNRPILKLIDEYNYSKFTKNWI